MAWTISNAMMSAYENSRSSLELAAESSVAICSDGERSAQSSTTPMPDQYYWPDKTTEHSRLSRFGMTCERLTGSHGEALLTWYLAGFPARTSAQLEREPDLMESEADSGVRWQGSLARYDRAASLWRTAQSSLVEGLDEYSETWPRWGSMLSGELYLRQTPALPTSESESGFWPTPNVPNGGRSTKHITDWRGKSAYHNGKKVQVGLESVLGGAPHPTFLEWLMGWPIGWTDIKPLAMDKFREWQHQHGGF